MPETSYFDILLGFIGGLGLFLFGMNFMASGLQKSTGTKMKKVLEVLTRNKFLAILMGAGVAAIIQSSSATTVMVVGFVNAGIMNISQSVGIIMGANIGTTVTGWLVASVEWSKLLNPSTLAPLFVGAGVVMLTFINNNKVKQIGEIVCGLGILFIGMNTMSASMKPLSELEFFRELFVTLGTNPFFGVLAGLLVTAILQSSSASVGILQSLAMSGLVPWSAAVYIIMGQNIGTCVTALMSSIGTTKNAKSAAYIHLLFNVIGSVIFSILAAIFFTFINPKIGQSLISLTQISLVHTTFNVINTAMMYPFSDKIIVLAQKLASIGKVEEDEAALVHLDDRVLSTPGFAIQNCIKEIVRLGNLALNNLKSSTQSLLENDTSKIEKVLKKEKKIDALANAITNYMIKLCNENITEQENETITFLFQIVNDMERIGDHCENIAELCLYAKEEEVSFTAKGKEEIIEIVDATIECFENALYSLEQNDKNFAKKVLYCEEDVDSMEEVFRTAHIQRLSNNECNAASGVVFLDTLTNLERISDHSLNIAQFAMNSTLREQ